MHYKPVAKKVHAIVALLEKELHITQTLPANQPLPSHPPHFIPGICFTQECTDHLDLDSANWVWPDEAKLVHCIVIKHEMAFIWVPTDRGHLDK